VKSETQEKGNINNITTTALDFDKNIDYLKME